MFYSHTHILALLLALCILVVDTGLYYKIDSTGKL